LGVTARSQLLSFFSRQNFRGSYHLACSVLSIAAAISAAFKPAD